MLTPPATIASSFQVKVCGIANASQLLHWGFSRRRSDETEAKGIRRLDV